jgi:hypothetical protein
MAREPHFPDDAQKAVDGYSQYSSNPYYLMGDSAKWKLHIPFLSIGSYYDFLSTTMIVLFIVGLVIVFVYEYEALRRSKT